MAADFADVYSNFARLSCRGNLRQKVLDISNDIRGLLKAPMKFSLRSDADQMIRARMANQFFKSPSDFNALTPGEIYLAVFSHPAWSAKFSNPKSAAEGYGGADFFLVVRRQGRLLLLASVRDLHHEGHPTPHADLVQIPTNPDPFFKNKCTLGVLDMDAASVFIRVWKKASTFNGISESDQNKMLKRWIGDPKSGECFDDDISQGVDLLAYVIDSQEKASTASRRATVPREDVVTAPATSAGAPPVLTRASLQQTFETIVLRIVDGNTGELERIHKFSGFPSTYRDETFYDGFTNLSCLFRQVALWMDDRGAETSLLLTPVLKFCDVYVVGEEWSNLGLRLSSAAEAVPGVFTEAFLRTLSEKLENNKNVPRAWSRS